MIYESDVGIECGKTVYDAILANIKRLKKRGIKTEIFATKKKDWYVIIFKDVEWSIYDPIVNQIQRDLLYFKSNDCNDDQNCAYHLIRIGSLDQDIEHDFNNCFSSLNRFVLDLGIEIINGSNIYKEEITDV